MNKNEMFDQDQVISDVKNTEELVETVDTEEFSQPDMEVDEDTVYTLTKSLFDNQEAIANANSKGAELDINTAAQGIPTPLHPGAEKYYKEAGVLE